MGREFELKYAATEEILEALRKLYPHLAPIAMQTTYYDTPDGALGNAFWTLRRRMENGVSVCTLKTPASDYGRNEWEVNCGEILDAVGPLLEAGAPEQLLSFTARGLTVSCGAEFTRLAGLLEVEGATVELALDRGVLTGGGRVLPFTEVEVELKSGSEAAAVRFARALAARFGMQIQPKSKVARARALARL